MGFLLFSNIKNKYKMIENDFINSHMLSANGNFVKIYLLLQSAVQHPHLYGELSVSVLADRLECTENDILRALRYWAKNGLLHITESNGEISEIVVGASDLEGVSASVNVSALEEHDNVPRESAATIQPVTYNIPQKHEYSPLQTSALANDIEIQTAIQSIEHILGSNVTPAHLQMILYFMCDIGFSCELLCTMYEVGVSKGHKEPNYIETIGLSWAKKGIRTRDEALNESAGYDTFYLTVKKALGFHRNFAPAEREIIDTWKSYNFDEAIINEACKRTVLQTGDTNLNYLASILKDWHSKNVQTIADIELCDEAYKKQKTEKKAPKKSGNNHFANFPQRAYSNDQSSSIERKLLQAKNRKGSAT